MQEDINNSKDYSYNILERIISRIHKNLPNEQDTIVRTIIRRNYNGNLSIEVDRKVDSTTQGCIDLCN